MKTSKKIIGIAGLVADLAPGVLVLLAGLGMVGGGMTGVLW